MRTALLVVLGILLAAILASGGYAVKLAHTYNARVQIIATAFPEPTKRPPPPPAAVGALTILLLGTDIPEGNGASAVPGAPGAARADTMMVLHVPADGREIYVMSILRDTWTEIPGVGETKINAAFALGGVPLVVETVEGLFRAPIDHVVLIDFEGFTHLTNALDGVTLTNEVSFLSEGVYGERFDKGVITLKGESALKFVRERYAFPDGDYQRVRNQQLFVKAVLSKFLSADTLMDPLKVHAIVDQVAPYLSVDEGFDASMVARLAFQLRRVGPEDVRFFTLPDLGFGTSPDGQSIILKDDAAIARIGRALNNDELGDYLDASSVAK